MRKLIKIELCFAGPEGSWRANLHEDKSWSVGGSPCPSESQAWYFDKHVIPAIELICQLSQHELDEFVKQFGRPK